MSILLIRKTTANKQSLVKRISKAIQKLLEPFLSVKNYIFLMAFNQRLFYNYRAINLTRWKIIMAKPSSHAEEIPLIIATTTEDYDAVLTLLDSGNL